MPERTARGLAIVSAALSFGLAADVLGRAVPGRLDVALGAGFLVLLVGYLVQREPALPAPPAGLGLAAGVLALALIWRDSPTLFGLNLLALGVIGALAAPRLRSRGMARVGVSEYAAGALDLAAGTAAGAAGLLFSDIDWRCLPADGPVRRLRGPAVGLVAAVPVAALFGGLLMDADPVFDRLVTDAVTLRLDVLAPHAAAILLWAWFAAGLLRTVLGDTAPTRPADRPHGRFGLGEVATVLGVVDLLFLAFVAVQFRYLFGGAELVRSVTGLGYAEYARSGFFQLVTVAALSLPLLLAADWALGQRDRAQLRRFRFLALTMLLLLDVMLASALYRMRLYTAEYGLTELRFYTTAFMGWLVVVLGWFAATVLRSRRSRFAPGALVAGAFVLGALNLLNPDAMIARVNLARAAEGREVDARYAGRLSADAVPTLLRLVEGLPAADRCAVVAALRDRWSRELAAGGRWDMGMSRATRRVRARGWATGAVGCAEFRMTSLRPSAGGRTRRDGDSDALEERGGKPVSRGA